MENTLGQAANSQVVSDQVTSGQIATAQATSSKAPSVDVSTSPDPLLSNRVEPEDLEERWTRWKCLVCGFVYEGRQALHKCPKCGNEDPDKFEDAD